MARRRGRTNPPPGGSPVSNRTDSRGPIPPPWGRADSAAGRAGWGWFRLPSSERWPRDPHPGPPLRFGSALPQGGGITRAFATTAILALFALTASAHAFEQRQVGSWVLKWATAQIGFYCTVETVQDGRTLGYQVVRDGRIFFGLRNPDWRWEPKSVHDAKLIVAGEAEWTGKVVSALPDTLVMPIRPDPNLDPAMAMEASKTVAFEVEGRTITYDLAGFPEAAKAQRECLAKP